MSPKQSAGPTVRELEEFDDEIRSQSSPDELRLLEAHPVDEFLGYFEHAGPRRYNHLPPVLEQWFPKTTEDESASRTYMRMALLTRMRQFLIRGTAEHYPESIKCQYEIHLNLMVREFRRRRSDYFRLRNDLFLKDLALVDGRMAPAGAQLIETLSGVPRSILIRCGLVAAIEFSLFWISELRGFAPFFEMHTDPRRIREFTPQGWNCFYLRAAELLERRPEILGLWSGAWWNDPAVPKISPDLAFLQEVPLAHGARTFRFSENDAKANALRFSIARQQAYESGVYRPTNYFLIWSRNDIMRWAKEFEKAGGSSNRC